MLLFCLIWKGCPIKVQWRTEVYSPNNTTLGSISYPVFPNRLLLIYSWQSTRISVRPTTNRLPNLLLVLHVQSFALLSVYVSYPSPSLPWIPKQPVSIISLKRQKISVKSKSRSYWWSLWLELSNQSIKCPKSTFKNNIHWTKYCTKC